MEESLAELSIKLNRMSASDGFLRKHKDAILAGLELHEADLHSRLLALTSDTPGADEKFRVISGAHIETTRAVEALKAMEWPEG
ncbi:hypothetical protein ACFYW9_19230 [Streptomyces sp. NPDC002698]|uniref:hypothetical protein n=1 Tax=Streptomyces sp. NPDC002698 TaxID=3364660 RepID=UPI003681A05A